MGTQPPASGPKCRKPETMRRVAGLRSENKGQLCPSLAGVYGRKPGCLFLSKQTCSNGAICQNKLCCVGVGEGGLGGEGAAPLPSPVGAVYLRRMTNGSEAEACGNDTQSKKNNSVWRRMGSSSLDV